MKVNDVNESQPMKQNKLSHLVQRTHWHMSVDIPSCMVAEPLIVDCLCRVVVGTSQDVELPRRQLDELTAQMDDVRQQSTNAAMNAAVTGQSVSKQRPEDMRVGTPEPYLLGKEFDDWHFAFSGSPATHDPAYPCLPRAARQSTTSLMAKAPHEQQSATLLYFRTGLTQQGARKISWKGGNNGVEAYTQLCFV